MTQRKMRIDADDTPATEEDKFHMKHNDLLKFADRMMTEDNIKNKIFEGKEIDPSINHKALLTRDWVRWKEDFNGKIKDLKLLINRSVIGINKKFEGEDLGGITPENFMEHFGDKTLAAMEKVYNEFDAGIKFKFSIQ